MGLQLWAKADLLRVTKESRALPGLASSTRPPGCPVSSVLEAKQVIKSIGLNGAFIGLLRTGPVSGTLLIKATYSQNPSDRSAPAGHTPILSRLVSNLGCGPGTSSRTLPPQDSARSQLPPQTRLPSVFWFLFA